MRPTTTLLFAVVFAYAAQWYEGGTLHKGTLGEWRKAAAANRLATAADLSVQAMPKPKSMAEMRRNAEAMMRCVDEVATEAKLSRQPVTQVAAACATLLTAPK